MCFKPKILKHLNIPKICLNGVVLPLVSKTRYLGFNICDTLCDDSDIERHVKFLYYRGNMLLRKFSSCTFNVKLKLFGVFCTSLYGGHLWTTFHKSHLNRAKVAFNSIYRKLFNVQYGESISMSMLFNRVNNFTVLRRKFTLGFRQRLLQSENSLVNEIVHSNYFTLYSSMSNLYGRSLLICCNSVICLYSDSTYITVIHFCLTCSKC